MICPICKNAGARRSRRRNLADYVLSALGAYPWRCQECHSRFYARLMSPSDSLHAHCPICGNLDLKRIDPSLVDRPLAFLGRTFRLPAYRCEPCRYKYFSLLPQRQAEQEGVSLSSAD